MSIITLSEGVYEVRWREGGRHRSQRVHGSHDLAKKVLRKKMSLRDENRHLDVKKEVNYKMSDLIDRYWEEFGSKKGSADREKAILENLRDELGDMFVREVDGNMLQRWYDRLVHIHGLEQNTALRHYNPVRHMFDKAATIWTKETGIDRNPASMIEVVRPDDQRDRFLDEHEIRELKRVLDEMQYQRGRGHAINQTNLRMRMKTLLSFGAGLRSDEINKLTVSGLLFDQELIAVRTKLKRSPMRYVPMPPELAEELQRYLRLRANPQHPMLFPPRLGAEEGKRQRVDKSFNKALRAAKIEDFRFHDLRHTFASWYMMKGGDLYDLSKILGHRNIKTTERYAKLARKHIARTGSTAREVWSMMDGDVRVNAAAA